MTSCRDLGLASHPSRLLPIVARLPGERASRAENPSGTHLAPLLIEVLCTRQAGTSIPFFFWDEHRPRGETYAPSPLCAL